MAEPTYVVPPINSKGTFSFETPFNVNMYDSKEYTVRSIRLLKEIYDSEEDPYTNIYKVNGLSEDDFKSDLENNIPIVVLSDSGNQYYYVPASKIKSMPKVSGVKYQEVMIAINLGYLPLDFNIDDAKTIVVDDILSTLGITSTAQAIKTSAVQVITETEDQTYRNLLKGKKTNNQSDRTKYKLLLEKFNAATAKITQLENCIANHILQNKTT